jgi:hypothetical protein
MSDRAEVLDGAPMRFAPENELGVVYLFSSVAHQLQLRIERMSPGFPDCLAYRRAGGRERAVRIEFEFRSSRFRFHHHRHQRCDCIVCWEHDWPEVPRHIQVVELRPFFCSSFRVWIQPAKKHQWHWLENEQTQWGLSKRARKGDLLLMYRCVPACRIQDVFEVVSDMAVAAADWRNGSCYLAAITRICTLRHPLTLTEMREDRVLGDSSFVRRNMQGNLHATEYWPNLYGIMTRKNPDVVRRLKGFNPARV